MRGNKKGPEEMGPKTGRGLGFCAGYDQPGYLNPEGNGRGLGRGFNQGRGFGRGFGRGRGAAFQRGRGFGRGYFREETLEDKNKSVE